MPRVRRQISGPRIFLVIPPTPLFESPRILSPGSPCLIPSRYRSYSLFYLCEESFPLSLKLVIPFPYVREKDCLREKRNAGSPEAFFLIFLSAWPSERAGSGPVFAARFRISLIESFLPNAFLSTSLPSVPPASRALTVNGASGVFPKPNSCGSQNFWQVHLPSGFPPLRTCPLVGSLPRSRNLRNSWIADLDGSSPAVHAHFFFHKYLSRRRFVL